MHMQPLKQGVEIWLTVSQVRSGVVGPAARHLEPREARQHVGAAGQEGEGARDVLCVGREEWGQSRVGEATKRSAEVGRWRSTRRRLAAWVRRVARHVGLQRQARRHKQQGAPQVGEWQQACELPPFTHLHVCVPLIPHGLQKSTGVFLLCIVDVRAGPAGLAWG